MTIAVVFGLRMLALRYGLRTPEPVDLPHSLARRGRAVLRHPREGTRRSQADGVTRETAHED